MQPRRRVESGQDGKSGSVGFFSGRRVDWLGSETGHTIEYEEVACGSQHTIALTRAGQVYTWGSNEFNQLGHTLRVLQRLPCLLSALQRPLPGSRRKMPIMDVRSLGCGRKFSAALTWRGEVWAWGRLGARTIPTPALLDRLHQATIVDIACGSDHLAMVTGDAVQLHARADDMHVDEVRNQALAREQGHFEERIRADVANAQEASAVRKAQREAVIAEKRRVKLLNRLAKQRARVEGLKKLKKKKKKSKEDAENAADGESGGGGTEDGKSKKR